MRAIPFLVAVAGALVAQTRLPVPDAAQRAAAREGLLAALARVAPDSDRVLALANDASLAAVVRFELCEHAERIARAAHDVAAGLRAADARAALFAVTCDAARAACLARFQAEAAAPSQVLAGARLDEALRLVEAAPDAFAAQLDAARHLAVVDVPRGLRAHVEAEAQALQSVRAAFERSAAAPDDTALRGRYCALYRGQWEVGLAALRRGDDRPARIAASKLQASAAEPIASEQLLRSAEEWLSLSQREPDAIAQRHLRRRAMTLLTPIVSASWPTTDADVPEWLSGGEGKRVRALLDRATDLTVATFAPAVHALTFATPADLDALLVTGGEWRVDDHALVGRNTGGATRATARLPWRSIDCVTIRGGIRSRDGLNFRIAIGSFNALFNWEVEDQNHFYFGEQVVVVGPRLLQANQEHVIRVRQIDQSIAVTVDGAPPIAVGPGTLSGSVSVYPAVGSEIFVRSIEVVGDVDLGVVVNGPTGKTR